MRHRKAGYKLGRTTAHRESTLRNLTAGLIEHGQITTTVPKAKALQPYAEKLITLARRGDLHARRLAVAKLQDRVMADNEELVERNRYGELRKGPKLISKLFDELGPRFAQRPGGYTRIVKLGQWRKGDGADLCVLQLVGEEEGPALTDTKSPRRDHADRRAAYVAEAVKSLGSNAVPAAAAASADEASSNEASGNEASGNEASSDEVSGDDAKS